MVPKAFPAIATAIVAVLAPTDASACECVVPRDREALRAYIMETMTHVFAAHVLSVRKRPSQDKHNTAPLIEARVRVLKQLKGELPEVISVVSSGGDTGANCGFGDGLARAWATEIPVTLVVGEVPKKNGKAYYTVSGCTSGRFYINPSK